MKAAHMAITRGSTSFDELFATRQKCCHKRLPLMSGASWSG